MRHGVRIALDWGDARIGVSSHFSMSWIICGKRGCLGLPGVSGACSG
jgi:hypothetical protein